MAHRRLIGAGAATMAAAMLAAGASAAQGAPRVLEVEAFARPSGGLLVRVETPRDTAARPPVVTVSVGRRTVRATAERLDGSEGPSYRMDHDALVPGARRAEGQRVSVRVRACQAGACAVRTRSVEVDPWADR